MRPRTLDEFVGQEQVLDPGKPLRQALEKGQLHSLILWGPPGTGKTTLARLIARRADAEFIQLSAVMAGVKDIREAVERARTTRGERGRRTVLFLDEVHRFNKSQQDTFLPYVEDGTLTFIGATTENPSFEVISALLSRARVYVLRSLGVDAIVKLLRRALDDRERGLGARNLAIDDQALVALAHAGDGDARRALGMLEVVADLAVTKEGVGDGRATITIDQVREVASGGRRRFDKGGEQFYDQISALHKAVRGTDPDAALYWFARMLDGGCDPHYLARRILRMAIEDIGLADPRGAAAGARSLADFRTPRQSRRRAGAGECAGLSRRGTQEQFGIRGLWRGTCRRRAVRHARRAGSLSQCADEADERAGLRRRLSLRARRAGRVCERRAIFSG